MLVFHRKVYIFLFFCVLLEKCFFGTACVQTAYQLSAVKGAFPKVQKWRGDTGLMQTERVKCVLKSREQPPSDSDVILFKCLWFKHQRKKKKRWVSNQKIMFLHYRKCLTMKCFGCHIVFVETWRCYCEWPFFYGWLSHSTGRVTRCRASIP